jgi:hypothetical protein
MNVSMATDNGANYFNIIEPGRSNEAMFVGSSAGNQFEGTLPASGDYKVRVYLMRSAHAGLLPEQQHGGPLHRHPRRGLRRRAGAVNASPGNNAFFGIINVVTNRLQVQGPRVSASLGSNDNGRLFARAGQETDVGFWT